MRILTRSKIGVSKLLDIYRLCWNHNQLHIRLSIIEYGVISQSIQDIVAAMVGIPPNVLKEVKANFHAGK